MEEINAYLVFNGNCREAMSFYAKALGADLHSFPFADMPGGAPPGVGDRLMHARLSKGKAVLMASDNMPGMPFEQGNNFSVSIQFGNAQEAERCFNALAESGKVTMPMQETFWASRFGMLTDQFGINWMLNVEKPQPAA
jgi:PhnB protein